MTQSFLVPSNRLRTPTLKPYNLSRDYANPPNYSLKTDPSTLAPLLRQRTTYADGEKSRNKPHLARPASTSECSKPTPK